MAQDLDPQRTGTGFADLLDYRLIRWEEGLAEVAITVAQQHLNRSGLAHGGLLATLLDAACGYAGCYSAAPAAPRRALTLALNTQFIAAARLGDRLLCQARQTGGGATVFFATAEVREQEGRLIARGDGVFKYRSSQGRTGPRASVS